MHYIQPSYIEVTSSNLTAIAWADGNLFVKFKHGGEYRYADVPLEVFEKMKVATSVGQFLSQEIKPKYKFEKVTTAQ